MELGRAGAKGCGEAHHPYMTQNVVRFWQTAVCTLSLVLLHMFFK